MQMGLKLQQLIFNEQGLVFQIKRKETGESFYCPATELFYNDKLLTEFSSMDIRSIIYFASVQEHQSDQIFLQKLHNDSSVDMIKGREAGSGLANPPSYLSYISSGVRK